MEYKHNLKNNDVNMYIFRTINCIKKYADRFYNSIMNKCFLNYENRRLS